MPQIPAHELDTQRYLFADKMADTLQLSDAEHAALSQVPAETLMYWGVTVFAPEENEVKVPECSAEIVLGPAEHHEFLAGKADVGGLPMWDFRKGQLARKIGSLYASASEADQQRFTDVSATTARAVFAMAGGIGLESHEVNALIAMNPDLQIVASSPEERQLVIDGASMPHPIDGATERIALMNPGMSGAMFAAHALGAARDIHFISGGMGARFVNSWNDLSMLATESGRREVRNSGIASLMYDGVDMLNVEGPEPHFYHQGITKSAEQFTEPDTLDVAIMRQQHAAGLAECAGGVALAARTLREDGLFVVKAPNTSAGNEACLDKIAPIAQEAFGSPIAAGETSPILQFTNPELPTERPSSYLIYRR